MFPPTTKVLVVDDMGMMRTAVKKFLVEFGLSDIHEAADGIDAWTAISSAEKPFDLIISDWNMPKCTGIDLLKRVRADKRYLKTPLILVTAEKEKEQILEAIKAGVSSYVVKPFNSQGLREKLEALHAKLLK
jgi:two-component system chemotaxis response regulator CheY